MDSSLGCSSGLFVKSFIKVAQQPEKCEQIRSWQLNMIIVTCHDSLPPSRRSSHVKSDNARLIIKHTPLSPLTIGTCA